jgi:2-methylcitrate dehydratase PrpD
VNETKDLAKFLTELKYEDIPKSVIKKTEELTLDQFGVQVFASTKPWCRAVYEQVKKLKSSGKSSILNYGDKMGVELAAFVNGTFGHGFEMDDTYPRANLHPGCVLISTAMAMGEARRIDGKLLLLSLVAGYEAMGRIARSLAPSIIARGHHPTGTTGPFGSAAVVGKILDFGPELMEHALGIAACMGSGTMQFTLTGGSLKRIYGGIGAQGGIKAALLALEGLTSPSAAIEGDTGFAKAYSDSFRPDEITLDFGKSWVAPELIYKRYPTDYMLQALLDALLQLKQEHNIKASDVKQILAGSNKVAFRIIGTIKEPKEISAAQFSAAFCLGLALVKGSCEPKDLVETNLTDPEILATARKVTLELDDEVQAAYPVKRGGRVKLVLNNGTTFSKTILDLKGTPFNPMTREEIEDKFRRLGGAVLQPDKVERVVRAVRDLEHIRDVSRLARLLVA